jgi:hypothetical protein
MFFVIFHQDTRRLFTGTRSKKSRFGHSFGGATDYGGLKRFKSQPPVHLLFRLNMTDPAVGITLADLQWLPLLCAIRYGACHLGYRILSDSAVKILYQNESKAWDGFPYNDYPDKLPEQSLILKEVKYNPNKPKDAYVLAGIFGSEVLTPRQFARLASFLVEEELYPEPELYGGEWESPEEYLRIAHCWPFVQGRPHEACPDRNCPNHGQRGSLRIFAVFEEREKEVHRFLWGPGGPFLQIIYQICPKCSAIRVSNQCT